MNSTFYSTLARTLTISVCLLMASGFTHPLRAQVGRTPVAKLEIRGGQVVKMEQQAVARPDGVTDDKGRVVRPRKLDSKMRESDQPTLVPRGDIFSAPEKESGLTVDNAPFTPEAAADEARRLSLPGSVDLVISSVAVLDATGPGIKFRFVIGNNGPDAVTTNFQCHVYLSDNVLISPSDHYLIFYWCNDDIAGGATRSSADLSFTVEGVPDGSYYLGVIADGSNVVTETNESNNMNFDSTPKVTITNPGTRDLLVSSVQVLDGSGPSIGYSFSLSNSGTASIPAGFETDVVLSLDTYISSSDYLVETRTATAALGGISTYNSPNIYRTVSGVPDGSYYLGVIADASHVVDETREDNNTYYDGTPLVSIGSSGTYDLDVISVEVLDATGPELQFRYTIGNNGTAMITAGFQNDIYLSANTTISETDYKIDTRTATADIPAGGNYTSSTLSRTVSGVPDGSYYLGVITDAGDAITETNESNNTGYDSSPQVTLTTVDTYDLDVSTVEVLDGTGPNITFRYTLVNHGTGAITVTFSNAFYLSLNATISTADHLIGTRSTVTDIAAGGSYTSADLDYTVSGLADGSYYLGVITDAGGVITESDETNNIGYDPSPLVVVNAAKVYDLDVISVEAIDATGPDITFKYTIGNSGTGEVAMGFENHIYLSGNTTISASDYLIDTWVSGQAVPAGGSYTTRELACTVTGVPDGTYYLGVITDGGGDVDETNEFNNTGYDSTPQVTISATRVYDLYVSGVEVLDETCPDIQYRYTIGNHGTDVVPMGFENRVYLSDDATITSADHLIDTRIASNSVPAAGTYTSTSLSCAVGGVPDGSYYLGVIVDAAAAVAETNEGNNSGHDNAHKLTVSSMGVEPLPAALPARFQVLQNYPNPFNPSTTIEFHLPWESDVRLTVFNMLGQEVERLASGRKPAGVFRATWQASNVAAGVYYGRFVAKPLDGSRGKDGYVETVRMILVK